MIYKKRCMYFQVLLLVALSFMTATALRDASAQPPETSALMEKAVTKGEVLVIVGLKLPKVFKPEGHLTGQEVAEQRKAIADARKALKESLAGYKAKDYKSWKTLPYVAMRVDAAALDNLTRNPLVTTIQENVPEPPSLASTTALIGADVTWNAGFGGLGQAVVILDTGIDRDHPFYGGNGSGGVGRVVTEACFSAASGGVSLCPNGANSQTGPGSADATTAQCLNGAANICEHGSHVAGIAAGRDPGGQGYSGIAPEANIIAIQVFSRFNNDADCGGPGTAPCASSWPDDQLDALEYIHTNLLSWNIASVNMSLGGGKHTTDCNGDSRKPAIDTLIADGIATCIASGNDGYTDSLNHPGCISTAVTVGAVTDTDVPPADSVIFNMHSLVDLLAVGANVDSSIPDDTWGLGWWGTSMATPQVTGAFAVIKALRPGWSVQDILTHLQTTGVLVTDNRPPNPANEPAGITKPRLQLDAAVAALTDADLQVFKECKPDTSILVGDTATCTITVKNWGPDPAINITVTDTHVSNGIFTFGPVNTSAGTCDVSANPQVGSGTITCTIMSLAPNDSITITVPVTAATPQDINDTVTVTAMNDRNADNNVATGAVHVRENSADLSITKLCKPDSGPWYAGQPNPPYCEMVVANLGPDTAKGVKFKDEIVGSAPFKITGVGGQDFSCQTTPVLGVPTTSATVSCQANVDLPKGATRKINVTYSADEPTDINDTASLTADTPDPNTNNNTATGHVQVAGAADLSLTKTVDFNPVTAGTDLTYTLAVTNNGPSTAKNVKIEDVLPAGVTIKSVSTAGGTCNAGVPGKALLPTTCTFDSLASGASKTMVIVVTVAPQTTGILDNNAKVSSETYDPNNSNNLATTATTVESKSDLGVVKSDYPDPVLAGKVLTYEVFITNNGPSTALDVTLNDSLPAYVTLQDYTVSKGSGTCSILPVQPATLSCDLNDLNPGEFVRVIINVLVSPSTPEGTVLTNTAIVTSMSTELNPADNVAESNTTVNSEADLAIGKEASVDTSNPSPRVTYTITVVNKGPSDALNVTMVDQLPLDPKKVVYLYDSGRGLCSYDVTTHDVTCNFGTLSASESVSVDIIVDVRGSVRTISNIAEVSSTTDDPNLANNTIRKDVRIKGGPGRK